MEGKELQMKVAEFEKRIADKGEDARKPEAIRKLEEDGTVFMAGLTQKDQQLVAEMLYIACMLEVCDERTELVVLAATCAKAANLTGECLEKLQTWLPGGVVPQDALLILTVSKILAERQKSAVVAA